MKKLITKSEFRIIDAIAERAHLMLPDRNIRDIRMDLIAVHTSYGLRLQDMLDGDDFDFIHDIVGIEANLDRSTFKMIRFVPRFADR